MVVARYIIPLAGICALATVAVAQDPHVRAWVAKENVRTDQTFWFYIEASGARVEMPAAFANVDGLIINTISPQKSQSYVRAGSHRRQTVRFAYHCTAIRPGQYTIPAMALMVNGRTMHTEPVHLVATGPAVTRAVNQDAVRLWVDSTTVTAGVPFWIYIEGKGRQVELPPRLAVPGLTFDAANRIRSSSFSSSGRGAGVRTQKHGFFATASKPGKLTVAPIEVRIDGQPVLTGRLKLEVVERQASSPRMGSKPGKQELKQDDLVFIKMAVDKQEVYQGEPIVLREQLWRIIYRQIDSGPYRGALLVTPSTEGFYVIPLEPKTFVADKRPWQYEVTEKRKILYPTTTGTLQIGQWHWEGVALVNRHNIVARDKLYYKLDSGPIDIVVKPLPSPPKGFSGAVGRFTLSASLSTDSFLQGVPITLTVSVSGRGNSDAIGDPVLPEVSWAYVGEPERKANTHIPSGAEYASVSKRFSYPLTPLEAGNFTIGPIEFIFFEPESGSYKMLKDGPFDLNVLESPESKHRMIVADDVERQERAIDIIAEDIQPIQVVKGPLEVRRGIPISLAPVVVLPVISYALFVGFINRRRRFKHDTGFARAYHARPKVTKRLGAVLHSDAPADELHRAVLSFIGDSLNISDAGMTSHDVDELLQREDIDAETCQNATKILRACERSVYASQPLSTQELRALTSAAEMLIDQLGEYARLKGVR